VPFIIIIIIIIIVIIFFFFLFVLPSSTYLFTACVEGFCDFI
jgi:hypothetical protein